MVNRLEKQAQHLRLADYVRVFRIALGGAREAQGWYFHARHSLSAEKVEHCVDLLDQIMAWLVNAISRHKRHFFNRHSPLKYETHNGN